MADPVKVAPMAVALAWLAALAAPLGPVDPAGAALGGGGGLLWP